MLGFFKRAIFDVSGEPHMNHYPTHFQISSMWRQIALISCLLEQGASRSPFALHDLGGPL